MREAVDDSLTKFSESTLLDAPGLKPLRQELLENVRRYYQSYVQRPGNRAAGGAELAAALARLARITAEIGPKEEALGYLRQARGIYEALAAANPSVAFYRYQLAEIVNSIAKIQQDPGTREKAPETRDGFAAPNEGR